METPVQIGAIVAVTMGLVEIIKALINKSIPAYFEREIIKMLESQAAAQRETLKVLVLLEERTRRCHESRES